MRKLEVRERWTENQPPPVPCLCVRPSDANPGQHTIRTAEEYEASKLLE